MACPCCGHTSKENRPNKGLTFVCQQCSYTLHADESWCQECCA
ncbi:MAG: zinc ribbon domain-containing protein [Coleofasciculus sp. G2-EDA-02]